jgi:hypothetical protein
MQVKANDVANSVNDAWAQYQVIQQQTKSVTLPPALKTEMEASGKELEAIRRRLGLGGGGGGGGFGGGAENVRGRIGQVKGAIMSSTSLPTDVQMRQLKELQAALPTLVSESNAAIAKVPALAKNLITANVLFGAIKPIQ